MPLITQKHGFDVATQRYTREGDPITEYEGRVVARYDLLLTRNFSDTLDYSDYQTAQVVKIVVKLDAPIADRYHYYSNPLYRKGVKQYRGKWHARLGVKRNPKDRDEDPMWVGDGEYTVERVIKLGATPA